MQVTDVANPVLMGLWCRPAATAPILPLAWEPPYAAGVAQEITKKTKNKNKKHSDIIGVPIMVQWLTNPTRNHEVADSIPGLAQCVNDPALL